MILLTGVGKNGLCGMLGLNPHAVLTAGADTVMAPVSGYDLFPEGKVIQVFPDGKVEKRAPTLNLYFLEDELVEIQLDYGHTGAPSLKDDVFEEVLGDPLDAPRDLRRRNLVLHEDGDLSVALYRKIDRYRRVFKEIVFRAAQLERDRADVFDKRLRAQAAFDAGMSKFNARKWKKAEVAFRKVGDIAPEMGLALVFEGIVKLRRERFAEAAEVAQKALEVSRDARTRAEAKGLLSVVALNASDKSVGLAHLREGVELDPANNELATAAKELESGEYSAARVAKTAARMSCLDKKRLVRKRKRRGEVWTEQGLLARGNFPNKRAFESARNRVENSREFKTELKRWIGWECR